MAKFFVEENQVNLDKNQITILGEDTNHINNVLRLRKNEKILVSVKSDNPKTYIVSIQNIEDNKVLCNIVKKLDILNEPKIQLSIFQGIPKFDKMEWIIQKCTELGASSFIPLDLKRCVVKLKSKDEIKKNERWQKISEVASKQSGRDIIPKVYGKISLNELCNKINDYDIVFVAYEQENDFSLKYYAEKIQNSRKIAIVIGPEGGFDESEVENLKNAGAKIISLGNRILRTETAPIALTSIIMYESGNLERVNSNGWIKRRCFFKK